MIMAVADQFLKEGASTPLIHLIYTEVPSKILGGAPRILSSLPASRDES